MGGGAGRGGEGLNSGCLGIARGVAGAQNKKNEKKSGAMAIILTVRLAGTGGVGGCSATASFPRMVAMDASETGRKPPNARSKACTGPNYLHASCFFPVPSCYHLLPSAPAVPSFPRVSPSPLPRLFPLFFGNSDKVRSKRLKNSSTSSFVIPRAQAAVKYGPGG